MNCKQAQQDIALFVGQDLDDPRDRDDVKRHVAACPDCRQHYRRMKAALKLLGQADAPETYVATGSLWPELATRISDRSSIGPRGRFNGWAPFVAMTAACLTLMLVVNEPQESHKPLSPPMTKAFQIGGGPRDVFVPLPRVTRPGDVPFSERNAGDDVEALRRDQHHEGY